jgi:hypothetical protein
MRKIFGVLILLLFISQTYAQHKLSPFSMYDSIMDAVEQNDYKKFRRQYISTKELLDIDYIKKMSDATEQTKEVQRRLDTLAVVSKREFHQLKDTLKKYGLSKKDLYFTSYKYMERKDPKKDERYSYAKNLTFYLVKDSLKIAFNPYPAFMYGDQWKMKYNLDIDVYPLRDREKNRKPYFVKTFPMSFMEFGDQMYELIKDQNIKKLLKTFATKKDLKKLLTNDKEIEKALIQIEENKARLQKEIGNYPEIKAYVPQKLSIYWPKHKYLEESDIRIALYLKTPKGSELLNIYAIITDKKLVVCDIATKLVKARY